MKVANEQRRDAIRRIVRAELIATQEELRDRLQKEGFECTQATLSRDLARLGARRAALAAGGSAYEIDEAKVLTDAGALEAAREMIVDVKHNGSLVVIQTLVGTAPAVGVIIDRARLGGILGTIAGDDTLFVAPTQGTSTGKLAKQLRHIWQKGS